MVDSTPISQTNVASHVPADAEVVQAVLALQTDNPQALTLGLPKLLALLRSAQPNWAISSSRLRSIRSAHGLINRSIVYTVVCYSTHQSKQFDFAHEAPSDLCVIDPPHERTESFVRDIVQIHQLEVSRAIPWRCICGQRAKELLSFPMPQLHAEKPYIFDMARPLCRVNSACDRQIHKDMFEQMKKSGSQYSLGNTEFPTLPAVLDEHGNIIRPEAPIREVAPDEDEMDMLNDLLEQYAPTTHGQSSRKNNTRSRKKSGRSSTFGNEGTRVEGDVQQTLSSLVEAAGQAASSSGVAVQPPPHHRTADEGSQKDQEEDYSDEEIIVYIPEAHRRKY